MLRTAGVQDFIYVGCDVLATYKKSIERIVYTDFKDATRNPVTTDYVSPNGQRSAGDSFFTDHLTSSSFTCAISRAMQSAMPRRFPTDSAS